MKVRTSAEGIYQLSYDELNDMGFSDPSKVQVYGYGGMPLTALNNHFSADFPDDIQPVATYHTSDGRVLFYGHGDVTFRSGTNGDKSTYSYVRNPYDTESYYFLSDVQGKPTMPRASDVSENSSYGPLASHIHIDYIEKEERNHTNGGALFHGPTHSPGESVGYTFSIRDYAPSATCTSGSFAYVYGLKSPYSTPLSVTLPDGLESTNQKSNSSAKGIDENNDNTTYFNEASGWMGFSYPDAPASVDEDFTFKVNIPNGSISYCAEDYVMLRYPRANRLNEQFPFLVMNFPSSEKKSGQKVVFENIPDGDLVVWGVDGASPVPFKSHYADGAASIVLNGSTDAAIAFRPSMTFPSAEFVEEIANQDLHALPTPDMLIITVADQEAAANEIAEIHRQYQGMDVLVLVHDKIYNEFSSGTRHAMAYRRLAKMFYDRDPQKFRFLMFLGPAYYDNRCVLGPKVDRMVTYQQDNAAYCNHIVYNYASDSYFAMLNDSYQHSNMPKERTQINVGRVSCINVSQAFTYVGKLKDRFENPLPAQVYNHALIMADSGNATTHSKQANEVIEAMRKLNPAISVSPMYAEGYPKDNSTVRHNAIVAALNRGAGIMTYIGHGSPTSIANWSVSEVTSTPYEYAPFVLFSSCDQYSFDHLKNGLVETMITTEKGGALGGVAAVRSVYINENQKTCVPVSEAYASSKPSDTFGDVFRRSRDIILDRYFENPNSVDFINETRAFHNILAYNLAGDPAIPIGVPEFAVDIEKVNDMSSDDSVAVDPYSPFAIAGTITSGGKVVEDYNGSIRIEVLDGSRTVKTVNTNGESNYVPNEVVYDSEVLALSFGEVKNGRFSLNVSVPTPTFIDSHYRIIATALSDKANAIGLFDKLVINDFDVDNYDESTFSAPSIKEFYADRPVFAPGDEITASSTIYALIDPSPSGLNTMTGNINTRTRLTVDGLQPYNNLEGYLSRSADGLLLLSVPLKQLSDGIHTIELCIVNNTGQAARDYIEVISTSRKSSIGITVEESPASTVATIDVAETPESSRLVITDASGATVFSKENPTFPYKWDLKSNGEDVPDGLYKASVLIQTGKSYGSTPAVPIIVLR